MIVFKYSKVYDSKKSSSWKKNRSSVAICLEEYILESMQK